MKDIIGRIRNTLKHIGVRSMLIALVVQDIPKGKISVSAGAVIHTEGDAASFEDLYACADRAMYSSKKTPGNSLTFGTM